MAVTLKIGIDDQITKDLLKTNEYPELTTDKKTIIDSINEVSDSTKLKQNITESTLLTTNKTIPGAINELYDSNGSTGWKDVAQFKEIIPGTPTQTASYEIKLNCMYRVKFGYLQDKSVSPYTFYSENYSDEFKCVNTFKPSTIQAESYPMYLYRPDPVKGIEISFSPVNNVFICTGTDFKAISVQEKAPLATDFVYIQDDVFETKPKQYFTK